MKEETKIERLKPQVEAALFMTNDVITEQHLIKMFGADKEILQKVLQELKIEYNKPEHGVQVFETSTGYQMKIKPDYAQKVRTLTPYKDLSRGLLKVLALVAYKQPITQSNIVKIIGNRAYDYVKKLEQKGLIRTEKHGRSKALIATKEFANYFGLETTEDFKKFFDKMVENEKKD
ncbi:MAG: SMC-Scp complex subunit ScpB [Candidatus Aenigmarchaeota archaeon]|nr:SMC-Scp complex subunit ScpB [Candidatus Aenigmarchaeota archaeon]